MQPTVDGTDDKADWEEVLEAMDAVSLTEDEKYELICVTAAVLHLGNIEFTEASTEVAKPENNECEYANLVDRGLAKCLCYFVSQEK